MHVAVTIGLAAGAVQLLAYAIYVRQSLAVAVRPNGTSWLMWTYGTLVFVGVEWNLGVAASLLVMPLACAGCSFFVAAYGIATGATLPPNRGDLGVLALDLGVMIGYALHAFAGLGGAALGPMFVAAAGVNALMSAWPTLRSTYAQPGNERPLAWFVWSIAYGLLALAAMIEGLAWPYLVYPLVNQLAALTIGLLALEGGDSSAEANQTPRTVAATDFRDLSRWSGSSRNQGLSQREPPRRRGPEAAANAVDKAFWRA